MGNIRNMANETMFQAQKLRADGKILIGSLMPNMPKTIMLLVIASNIKYVLATVPIDTGFQSPFLKLLHNL
jgi:hypothetical protein